MKDVKHLSFSTKLLIISSEYSLAAHTAKNLLAMQETWVRFLGWEDSWEKKWQPIPVLLPGESH